MIKDKEILSTDFTNAESLPTYCTTYANLCKLATGQKTTGPITKLEVGGIVFTGSKNLSEIYAAGGITYYTTTTTTP